MTGDEEPRRAVPWRRVNDDAPADAPALTPSKPPLPAWISREPVPLPVDVDEVADVVPPIVPPPAEELLPTAGTPVVAVNDVPASTGDDADRTDALHLLGAGAAANAALSAAGAPTPLGGVPRVEAEAPVTAPSFADGAPVFTPRFEPDLQQAERMRAATEGPAVTYEPRVIAAEPPPLVDAEPDADPETETVAVETVRRRRWWLWILLALLVLAGAAVATYFAFLRPDPEIIPGATVTQAPPEPTLTPVAIAEAIPDASDFALAMPTTSGTYVLQEATAVTADPATYGRTAQAVDLTYRDGDSEIQVLAIQYYSADAALAAWTAIVGEDATAEPVVAAGADVGQAAAVASPEPAMVWRNDSALFVATGPPTQLHAFFELYGL